MEIGIAIVNWDFEYVYANAALALYHGRKLEEYHNEHISELIPSHIFAVVASLYKHVLTTRLPVEAIEFVAPSVHSEEELIRWRASYLPIHQGLRVSICALSRIRMTAAVSPPALHTDALNILNCRYSDPHLSLVEVSKTLYVSPKCLSRVFKLYTGRTFRECLRDIRLREAKRLLKDSNQNIKAIAAMVGYTEPSHFIRYFEQATKQTPSEFRRHAISLAI